MVELASLQPLPSSPPPATGRFHAFLATGLLPSDPVDQGLVASFLLNSFLFPGVVATFN